MIASIAVAMTLVATMFRGNPAHTGIYESPAPTLKHIKWQFRAGALIMSSPTIAGDVVYVGSNDNNLYALRASDGTVRWKFATYGAVTSSPAVLDGVVYISSLDGYVYALRAAGGELLWKFKTEGERRFEAPGIHGIAPRHELMPDPFDMFISSPTVVDRTVYVGSGDHHVYALDATTGALRWKFATGDVVHASPAVANDTVYIGSWDRNFYALNATTGAVRWKFQTGDDQDIHNQIGIVGSAAVSNGTVYFGCRDSKFYALDARTGELKWKHDEHGSWVIGSPAIENGTVYFTTSDEKKFFALDAATGAERFFVKYGAFTFASPSIASGVAYFGTFDGVLLGVDLRSGAVAYRFESEHARPNLDLNTMYAETTLDGIFVGLNRIYDLGGFASSPAIAKGVLYVGSADGTLYALT